VAGVATVTARTRRLAPATPKQAGPDRAVGSTYCARCGAWIRDGEVIWWTATHIFVCQECH
jgi:hypothetical protein